MELYAWLEREQGLTRRRYAFPSVERAAEVAGLFIGEDFARRMQADQWTRIPECTGIWSRSSKL